MILTSCSFLCMMSIDCSRAHLSLQIPPTRTKKGKFYGMNHLITIRPPEFSNSHPRTLSTNPTQPAAALYARTPHHFNKFNHSSIDHQTMHETQSGTKATSSSIYMHDVFPEQLSSNHSHPPLHSQTSTNPPTAGRSAGLQEFH